MCDDARRRCVVLRNDGAGQSIKYLWDVVQLSTVIIYQEALIWSSLAPWDDNVPHFTQRA